MKLHHKILLIDDQETARESYKKHFNSAFDGIEFISHKTAADTIDFLMKNKDSLGNYIIIIDFNLNYWKHEDVSFHEHHINTGKNILDVLLKTSGNLNLVVYSGQQNPFGLNRYQFGGSWVLNPDRDAERLVNATVKIDELIERKEAYGPKLGAAYRTHSEHLNISREAKTFFYKTLLTKGDKGTHILRAGDFTWEIGIGQELVKSRDSDYYNYKLWKDEKLDSPTSFAFNDFKAPFELSTKPEDYTLSDIKSQLDKHEFSQKEFKIPVEIKFVHHLIDLYLSGKLASIKELSRTLMKYFDNGMLIESAKYLFDALKDQKRELKKVTDELKHENLPVVRQKLIGQVISTTSGEKGVRVKITTPDSDSAPSFVNFPKEMLKAKGCHRKRSFFEYTVLTPPFALTETHIEPVTPPTNIEIG